MADLSLIEGAALIVAGMGIGRFWPARRKGPKPPEPVRPVCGCDHHHSYHDPQTGQCHGRRNLGYWGGQQNYEDCSCRQYSGALPLPEYYAPEIASGEDGRG
jgi:hypothetical protein